MQCSNCGTSNRPEYKFCGTCGSPLNVTSPVVPAAPIPSAPYVASNTLTLDERQAILSHHITAYLHQGYRVVFQNETSAQLVKPKQFSCLIALICLALAVIGIGLIFFLLYLIIYWSSKDRTVYLDVDEEGRVQTIRK